MPCTPIPGGIVCSGRRTRKRCTYCGSPSDFLCDAVLLTGPRAGKTCDVPMCFRCTHRPAVNTDYCRDHRQPQKEAQP